MMDNDQSSISVFLRSLGNLPIDYENPEGPFLTVVMRFSGERTATLRDALVCLAGQIDQDFEVLLMAHNPAFPTDIAALRELVDEEVPTISPRVRVISSVGGTRSRPLNDSLAYADGRYIAFLDDDDLVLANWVSIFRVGADNVPGRIVRSVVVGQQCVHENWSEGRGLIANGPFEHDYPKRFSLLEHLISGMTPFHGLAFPRRTFFGFEFRFDESLAIFEDWDFELRAINYLGVESCETITAIYRHHKGADNSMMTFPLEDRLRMLDELITLRTKEVPYLIDGEELAEFRHSKLLIEKMWKEKESYHLENVYYHEMIDSPRWLARRLRELLRERRQKGRR